MKPDPRLCKCDTPALYAHKLDAEVRCSTCGKPPREDLGGADDLARVRYRANLNAIRETAKGFEPPPSIPRSEIRKLRMQERKRQAKALRARGYTQGQIAIRLGVSITTVQSYLNPTYEQRQRESNKRSRDTARAKKRKAEYMAKWREENRELNLQIVKECKARAA